MGLPAAVSRLLVLVIVLAAPAVLVVPVLAGPGAAAPDSARPPALHSSVPSHVPPPRPEPRGKPARAESPPVRVVEPERAGAEAGQRVDINAADVTTLMTLPGIDRTVAQRIVAYRETHGPFRRAADLRKVEGVGKAVWEKTRKHIVAK
jgi:competence ComEA-like helix-hairpin-helix protein